jgi:hypothetical protein
MKTTKALFIGISLFATTTMWSQTNLKINLTDNTSNEIDFNTVQNITFPTGFVSINKVGGGYDYLDITTIKSIFVNETVTAINTKNSATFFENMYAFPNPMEAVSTVSFELKEASKIKIEVLNADGTLVSSTEMNGQVGENKSEIYNSQNLSDGTYLLKISNLSTVETIKLIKF